MKTVRKQETASRANRMKSALNLALNPNFESDYGPYGKSGNPAGYFTYTHLGVEVRLRFSQATYEWLATCAHFDIEKTFPHQPPQDIQMLLNDWLSGHIEQPVSIAAQERMMRPSVLDIYEERAF